MRVVNMRFSTGNRPSVLCSGVTLLYLHSWTPGCIALRPPRRLPLRGPPLVPPRSAVNPRGPALPPPCFHRCLARRAAESPWVLSTLTLRHWQIEIVKQAGTATYYKKFECPVLEAYHAYDAIMSGRLDNRHRE